MGKNLFKEFILEDDKSVSALGINKLLFLLESKPRSLQIQIPEVLLSTGGECQGSSSWVRAHKSLNPSTNLPFLLSWGS